MKRFHFPLRPVAIVRAHKELRAREALALAIRGQAVAEAKLAECQRVAAEMADLISSGWSRAVPAASAAGAYQAYRAARTAEGEAEKQVAVARVEVLRRRAAGVEANRELKVISRLEDLARAAHRAEAQRVEQNEIDEIAGFRAFKNQPRL